MTAIKGFCNGCLPSLVLWAGIIALIASCSDTGGTNYPQPPERYQGNTSAAVHFMSQREVTRICQERGLPGSTAACAEIGGSQIWIENPCNWSGDGYAALLCHEIGHNNGWPAEHGDDG